MDLSALALARAREIVRDASIACLRSEPEGEAAVVRMAQSERLLAAVKALLEETSKIQPMPTGLGLARYHGLEAVDLAEGPSKNAGDAPIGMVDRLARGRP